VSIFNKRDGFPVLGNSSNTGIKKLKIKYLRYDTPFNSKKSLEFFLMKGYKSKDAQKSACVKLMI